MSLRVNLFRLGSSIQKHAGSRGAAPVRGVGDHVLHKNGGLRQTETALTSFFSEFQYEIDHISKVKNSKIRKIDFSFVSAQCASSL